MLFGIGGRADIDGGLRVSPDQVPEPEQDIDPAAAPAESVAVLAGGCFWCVEGVYRMLDGVLDVVSGYAGGARETANYRDVCSGRSGHAEVVRVRFDPARISYGRILKMFFAVAHDPTQLNRQGNDVGTQYRSAIFTADSAQREVAEAYIRQLNDANVFAAPIATEIAPLEVFYEAEDYHQDYAALNPTQPYIACTALPKMNKLREYFPDMLKSR
ncbi:MAG: peptide-methionine (S)-S-oxide reductase MsrA [Alphaproteobacteria bacterium]|nr:peptide-methionine (S)-S-oxide reductase MsrA [Alphaproteobacteria bacterium]